jgi:mercuric reductase
MINLPNSSERSGERFDLAVLGGGSAGFAAAIKGADMGAQVALIEGGTLGGTCVNVGCIPSKSLIRAAEAQHRRGHHGFRGIPTNDGTPDWSVVRAEKQELVERLRKTKYADVLRSYNAITLFQQRARLTAPYTLELANGTGLRAEKIVIATGSSPWAPSIPGLAKSGFLDSTSAMDLERLPNSLIVIGGSAVGLELAQMFARLGVRVTVVEVAPTLLPSEDPVIGSALATYLRQEGLSVHTNARVERVDRAEGFSLQVRLAQGTHTLTADRLLVATGRRPNTRDIGLDAAGIRLGARGEVVVDEQLETSVTGVYAAGDVMGDPMFVYVAAYAGTLAAENAIQGSNRRYDLTALPRVTFTDPGVASVGYSEAESSAYGIPPLISQLSLEHVPRALAARDTRGFVRLVANARTRQLIGAQILAPEAGEMITEVALAIRTKLTIEEIASSFHPYLTLAEGIKLAAQAFSKDVAKLSCCAA